MDIIKIMNFHQFIDEGCNYHITSKKCSLSITGLRKRLVSLEEGLKAKLFHTDGKKIIPTKEGIIFYEKTRRLIFEYNSALESIHKRRDENVLRISTTVAFGSLWISDYLIDFRETNPEIQISITASNEKPDPIFDNTDVFIGSKIEKKGLHLIQEKIDQYIMGLYATRDYIKINGNPSSVEDLSKHKLISFGEDGDSPYENIDWHLKLADQEIVPSYNINVGSGVLRAVELGFGIGVISSLAASLSSADLMRVLPNVERKKVDVYFTYPSYLKDDKTVLQLRDSLKENIRKKLDFPFIQHKSA